MFRLLLLYVSLGMKIASFSPTRQTVVAEV